MENRIKLINDNVPGFMALSGKLIKTRNPNNDAEFYLLLKDKIQEDVLRIFTSKEIEDKAKALADVYVDLEPLRYRLESKLSITFEEFLDKRIERTGKFKDQLVLESDVVQTLSLDDRKKIVIEFAEKNSYPEIILKADENGNPYKVLGRGQKSWESALGWADLEWPNNENFEDLFMAVKKKTTSGTSG